MNGDNARAQQLLQVQRLGFMLWDLRLFLDTHPQCRQAQEALAALWVQERQARSQYERRYGPLSWGGAAPSEAEQQADWVQGPWPWQGEV